MTSPSEIERKVQWVKTKHPIHDRAHYIARFWLDEDSAIQLGVEVDIRDKWEWFVADDNEETGGDETYGEGWMPSEAQAKAAAESVLWILAQCIECKLIDMHKGGCTYGRGEVSNG